MINKNNYEIYFLDYYEGNLPAEQVAELFLFLQQHPDLKAEFDAFENIKLTDDLLEEFPGKDALKKTEINEGNVQQFLIAEFEGDLNKSEQKELNEFIATHPALERDRSLYSKTKLIADASIKYPNKGELKKAISMFGIRNLIYATSIAASILLFLGIYFYSSQEINPAGNNSVAVVNNKNGSDKNPRKENQKSNDSVNQNAVQSIIPGNEVKSPTQKSYAEEKKNPDENQQKQVANEEKKPRENKEQQEQIKNNQNMPEQNVAQQQNPLPKQDPVNNVPQQVPEVHNPVAQNNVPIVSNNQNADAPKSLVSAVEVTSNENKNPAMALSQPVTVKEAASKFANEKLARLTGNDDFMDRGNKKNKKLDMLTWAVNKLGGKKVKMQTQYDADDKVADVNVTAKGFSIEHVKGF